MHRMNGAYLIANSMNPTDVEHDGSADPQFFIKEMLHMNAAGYQIWSEVLTPLLKAKGEP